MRSETGIRVPGVRAQAPGSSEEVTRFRKPLVSYSLHSRVRMQQRGYDKTDCDFVFTHGTQIGEEHIVMCCSDVGREISMRSRELQRLKRNTTNVASDTNCEGQRFMIRRLRELSAEIRKIRGLAQLTLVLSGGHVITCYRARHRHIRDLMKTNRLITRETRRGKAMAN